LQLHLLFSDQVNAYLGLVTVLPNHVDTAECAPSDAARTTVNVFLAGRIPFCGGRVVKSPIGRRVVADSAGAALGLRTAATLATHAAMAKNAR
jgi:hypothetical protein